MSKPTSAAKRKYNKSAYTRYEFSVRVDSSLAYQLELQKQSGESVSGLIKRLLCEHYGVSDTDVFVPDQLRFDRK